MNWEEFDKKVDVKGINEDIKEAEAGGEFKPVPHGVYEVTVKSLELKQSKKGDPMVSAQFKVLDGKEKGRIIFYNQVVTQGVQFHIANELLRSLETGVDVAFSGYAAYNDTIMDIKEAIDEQKLEYALDYGENDKGYDTFKINEVFSGN